MSHKIRPSHHSVRLSRGQMSGLMQLKRLCRTIHKISDPAAMLVWRKCQIIGATQRRNAGKARVMKRIACVEMGAFICSIVISVLYS